MTTRRQILANALGLGLTFVPLAGLATVARAAEPRFKVANDQFMLDGAPFQLLAGEMHYPRIPRASWRDRLRKLKALGLNTLTTYVFWNAHQGTPDRYDFSGNLDIAAYIRLAQEEGLWVNLRPGPYICGEWDGGGLPSWLFPTPDIAARSTDPRFLEPVKQWLKRLGTELTPLLIDHGGPIVLTQIENEYGAFGGDEDYLKAMEAALRAAGFDGVLYTADPAQYIAKGSLPGVVAGINFGTNYKAEQEFATRAKVRGDGPFFCSELWGGWFDAYGSLHATAETPALLASLKWMLERKYSFSFYMLHGGTSFGFTPGANLNPQGYQPDVASYDYDALLDEAGRPTPKYRAVEALFRQYLPADAFKPMPEPEPSINLPRLRLKSAASLNQLLGRPVTAPDPKTLEALGQVHGLIMYRHRTGKAGMKGTLQFAEVRDYAVLRSQAGLYGALDRRLKEASAEVMIAPGATLDVLVDTMGHSNYGGTIGRDQKGLIGPVTLNGVLVNGWDHYSLPLDDISGLRFGTAPVTGPAFYRVTFDLKATGYTFLDLRGWGKGYVWINGHNIGRYWSIGPQQAMFVPGSWLKIGENEIVILDLFEAGERTVASGKSEIWDLGGSVA